MAHWHTTLHWQLYRDHFPASDGCPTPYASEGFRTATRCRRGGKARAFKRPQEALRQRASLRYGPAASQQDRTVNKTNRTGAFFSTGKYTKGAHNGSSNQWSWRTYDHYFIYSNAWKY